MVSKQAGLVEIGADHVTVDEMAAAEAMLHAVVFRIGARAKQPGEERFEGQ